MFVLYSRKLKCMLMCEDVCLPRPPPLLKYPLQPGHIMCILSPLNSQRMRIMCPVCKGYKSAIEDTPIFRLDVVPNLYCSPGGTTEAEKTLVDLVTDQGLDFRMGFIRVCYDPKAVSNTSYL